jgi:hypothetical protein
VLVFPENVELMILSVLPPKFCPAPPDEDEVLFEKVQLIYVVSAGVLGVPPDALLNAPPFAAVFMVNTELEITAVPPAT